MNGREVIWDPLRKKEVALTPEEGVRQWCIKNLTDRSDVPAHLMMSEAGFKLGDKRFRADIIVYDRKAQPLMVVECKRPEVSITQEVLDQSIRYNMALNVRYILITNGRSSYVCQRVEKEGKVSYVFIDNIPSYNEMTK